MYTVHLALLRIIHNSTCIADIASFKLPSIRYFKTPPDNLGGVHISSEHQNY
jgi:hypothetical protein